MDREDIVNTIADIDEEISRLEGYLFEEHDDEEIFEIECEIDDLEEERASYRWKLGGLENAEL